MPTNHDAFFARTPGPGSTLAFFSTVALWATFWGAVLLSVARPLDGGVIDAAAVSLDRAAPPLCACSPAAPEQRVPPSEPVAPL